MNKPQKRKILVAGNWKMNGNLALIDSMSQTFATQDFKHVDVVVCPPAVYLSSFNEPDFAIGAQNVSHLDGGAYTGEVSISMLSELPVKYVIVGHSERREYFNESNELIAEKVYKILECGLTPIFCIGESEQIRESGKLFGFLAEQLDAVINRIGIQAFNQLIVAYEPIWAIGTGKTATPEQAQEVHHFIREHLAGHDANTASGVRILYGGSVNAASASALFSQPDVDGGLVGGASLKPTEFVNICLAAEQLG
ncbi:triose-phosphate isomerase [Neptunicella marina]|uniref:Triosephosphate isomerase n=1 Tax=Neptunicella marina TaxID=2125989 RepID=A0A8J6IRE7_9ALTE|nr:triose-phosphate isomerase [Neptunicella marina]MBC3764507.1 triose-phosphate isomerase [Neptunicella marina]